MAKWTVLALVALVSFAAILGADARKTVIVGGKCELEMFGDLVTVYTGKVDLVADGKVTPLPDLPTPTYRSTAVTHGGKLYSCGGKSDGNLSPKLCYSLDLSDASASWKSDLKLPTYTSAQPMLAVGSDLWIPYKRDIFSVPFNGDPYSRYELPPSMVVGIYSCGGSDAARRFVIPRGSDKVWVNTDAANPGHWAVKANIGYAFREIACMMTDTDIYVTGGSAKSTYYSTAVRVSFVGYRVHTLENMLDGRATHAMGTINGQIAVFGGYNGTTLDTVEVYNADEKKWTLVPKTLSAGKVKQMGYTSFD